MCIRDRLIADHAASALGIFKCAKALGDLRAIWFDTPCKLPSMET